MSQTSNDFSRCWWSLNDLQRRFLRFAYVIDKQLPHSDGMDKVMPPIGWRTVGLMCGIKLNEIDEFVKTLAGIHLVYILDAQACEMALICRHHLRELEHAQRIRRQNLICLIASMLVAAVTVLWLSRI